MNGGSGIAYGGPGNDTIHGGPDYDALYGNEDNDQIHGGDGADWIEGGPGNDSLYGGPNGGTPDIVAGQAGNDRLRGGGGNDRLWGGGGNDTLNGGDGGDSALDGGAGRDRIYGGAGDDFLNVLNGGAGSDTLTGGDGADIFRFNAYQTNRGDRDVVTDYTNADLVRPARISFPGASPPCGRDARVPRSARENPEGSSDPPRYRRKKPSPWGTKYLYTHSHPDISKSYGQRTRLGRGGRLARTPKTQARLPPCGEGRGGSKIWPRIETRRSRGRLLIMRRNHRGRISVFQSLLPAPPGTRLWRQDGLPRGGIHPSR